MVTKTQTSSQSKSGATNLGSYPGDTKSGVDGKYTGYESLVSGNSSYSSPYPAESIVGGDGGGGGLAPSPGEPVVPTQPPVKTPEQIAAENAARLEAAYQRALGFGNKQITDRGFNQQLVDQYGIMDAYKTLLDQRRSEIDPSMEGDLYNQFSVNDYFNNVVDSGQTRYRTDLRNSIMGAGGDGFEYDAFADTADDSILEAILSTQRNDAQMVLDRARARGQLNDVGYSRAATDLSGQGKGAMGTLQELGGGVLADYRSRLKNEYDTGLSRAGQASFNQPFNASSVVDRLNEMRTQLGSSLENDVYKAVGGTGFFTPSVSIGKGGASQGTVNPSKINFAENPLLAAFAPGADRRGYGGSNTGSTATTGAF